MTPYVIEDATSCKFIVGASAIRLNIWMNFPSHHQSGLFSSLKNLGVDLRVTYYESVSRERVAIGWNKTKELETWELSLPESGQSPLQRLQELNDYVHIIPGYGTALVRELARDASRLGIKWCHWSEAARPGWRWWARLPTKLAYARLVNEHAIGAFAQGVLARRDFIRWGIRADKIADLTYSVNTTGTNIAADSRIIDFAAGRCVFLFLGRMDNGKSIDVQLRALGKINSDTWCMALVGGGDVSKYQEMSQAIGLTDRVLFLPAVAWDSVSSIYQAGDVLLLPSRYEGWGVVANEAVALSKPLILSTACGAAWHMIEPGVNGFLVDPGSVDSLANAMGYYVRGGKELITAHGQESKRISALYSCDASALRLVKTLRSWLG